MQSCIFQTICLSPEIYFAELFFFEELFCRPKNFSDNAFISSSEVDGRFWTHVANCSKWSSSVQEEAQYILVTINNMVSVSVVENDVASYLWFYKVWSWNPEERVLHQNPFSAARQPCNIEDPFWISSSWQIRFLKKLNRWSRQGKERYGSILFVSLKSENLLFLSRLVKNVLYCSFCCLCSQRRWWADVQAFDANHECFSRLDTPNCDLVFMRL